MNIGNIRIDGHDLVPGRVVVSGGSASSKCARTSGLFHENAMYFRLVTRHKIRALARLTGSMRKKIEHSLAYWHFIRAARPIQASGLMAVIQSAKDPTNPALWNPLKCRGFSETYTKTYTLPHSIKIFPVKSECWSYT